MTRISAIACLVVAGLLLVSGCSSKRHSPGAAASTGAIVVSLPKDTVECIMVVRGQNSQEQTYQAKDSKFVIPAGSYDLVYYTIVARHTDNSRWSADGHVEMGSKVRMVVRPEVEKQMNIGKAFTAYVDVNQDGNDNVLLDLRIVDGTGIRYTIMKESEGAAQPGFEVLDSTGKKVWEGAFQYG